MSINFGEDPRVYHAGPYNPAYDPTIEGGRRWKELARLRWGVFDDGLGPHPLAHDGDAVVHFVRSETEKGTLSPELTAILTERVKWDGSPLTYIEAADLNRLTDRLTGQPYSVTINNALRAVQQPPVQPPVALPPIPDQGSELFESAHAISVTYPKGSVIRRAIGAFETNWGAINAAIKQAGTAGDPLYGYAGDGVETFENLLLEARAGLVRFYHALVAAYEDGRDYITGQEAETCQLACDAVWNTIHACRKKWMAAKETGWVLVAGDPRPTLFKWSRLNRICWTGLTNLTTACGLYGLRGELLKNGTRSAWYCDPFESFESQDPLRELGSGSGGIGVGGERPQPQAKGAKILQFPTFEDAVKATLPPVDTPDDTTAPKKEKK